MIMTIIIRIIMTIMIIMLIIIIRNGVVLRQPKTTRPTNALTFS
jgi:hypothetical protein